MLSWTRSPSYHTARLLHRRQLQSFYSSKVELPEYDYSAARTWFKGFDSLESLHHVGEVTYSRSSGPGGQNVNKYA